MHFVAKEKHREQQAAMISLCFFGEDYCSLHDFLLTYVSPRNFFSNISMSGSNGFQCFPSAPHCSNGIPGSRIKICTRKLNLTMKLLS